jgi:hypothetical protein
VCHNASTHKNIGTVCQSLSRPRDRQAKGPRSTLKDVLLCQFPDQAIDFIEPFLL